MVNYMERLETLLQKVFNDMLLALELDEDFSYDVDNEVVLIPRNPCVELHSEFAEPFLDSVRKLGGSTDTYCTYYWSLMHEVGHFYTIDDIEEDDSDLRKLCYALGVESMEMYANLPMEKAATEWAVQWTEGNPEQAQKINEFVISL
jgi:hypothetical protein